MSDKHPIRLDTVMFTKCMVTAVPGYAPPEGDMSLIPGPENNIQVRTEGKIVNLVKRFLGQIAVDRLGDLQQRVEFELFNFKLALNRQFRHSVKLARIV